uniref:Uncharacterized protein n=1 Tax=Noccaea caerulescens TaxID=107243 RepID=A0A1J3JLW1_NOCCA
MSRVLLFIFCLSALVGLINGRYVSSGSSSDLGSGPISVPYLLLAVFVALLLIGVIIAIHCACARWLKSINNKANLNHVSGQVVGANQMAHGTDLKSSPQSKTVKKGDPSY